MADMIMPITDRIKVTLADGGWQQASCNLRASLPVCLQSSPSVRWRLTLQWPDVDLILTDAIAIRHKDPGRTFEGPSSDNYYWQYRHIKFPVLWSAVNTCLEYCSISSALLWYQSVRSSMEGAAVRNLSNSGDSSYRKASSFSRFWSSTALRVTGEDGSIQNRQHNTDSGKCIMKILVANCNR